MHGQGAYEVIHKPFFHCFCRENKFPSPFPSPPAGGEGTVFMSGGDQEPVMRVYEFVNLAFFVFQLEHLPHASA